MRAHSRSTHTRAARCVGESEIGSGQRRGVIPFMRCCARVNSRKTGPLGRCTAALPFRRCRLPQPEMASKSNDYKVVILGASGVGKTCLGLRFVKDQFVAYTASTRGILPGQGARGATTRR